MGSMITLDIDGMYIDTGKNRGFIDHSPLFQLIDVLQIPYYYADNNVEVKEGFQKSLAEISKRLDLLGFSENQLDMHFQESLGDWLAWESGCNISFQDFKYLLVNIDLIPLVSDRELKGQSFCEVLSAYIFNSSLKDQLPEGEFDSEHLAEFFEYIHPYIILKLLALNHTSQSVFVEWRFADIVENGWVERSEVVHTLDIQHKTMIIAEGTTDVNVLDKVIEKLYPSISDFFYFIDMEEHYPFKGAGSLANFCMGLAKLQILNKVLVIFDNDVAGSESFAKLSSIDWPRNIHLVKLPELNEFNNIPTIGPSGESCQNINGSAVAIESFLDESLINSDLRRIRWTSYNPKQDKYQGELVGKKEIHQAFQAADLQGGAYNTSKLKCLVEYLIEKIQ